MEQWILLLLLQLKTHEKIELNSDQISQKVSQNARKRSLSPKPLNQSNWVASLGLVWFPIRLDLTWQEGEEDYLDWHVRWIFTRIRSSTDWLTDRIGFPFRPQLTCTVNAQNERKQTCFEGFKQANPSKPQIRFHPNLKRFESKSIGSLLLWSSKRRPEKNWKRFINYSINIYQVKSNTAKWNRDPIQVECFFWSLVKWSWRTWSSLLLVLSKSKLIKLI